jgi:hypothetical protein
MEEEEGKKEMVLHKGVHVWGEVADGHVRIDGSRKHQTGAMQGL